MSELNEGIIIVLSSPSGAGKTTLAKKNITINSVSPGFILSEMTNKISEDHTELLKSRISLNKFGKPEDVANTVAFLSSNLADYITGETIHVNGGMYFS